MWLISCYESGFNLFTDPTTAINSTKVKTFGEMYRSYGWGDLKMLSVVKSDGHSNIP